MSQHFPLPYITETRKKMRFFILTECFKPDRLHFKSVIIKLL